MVIATDHFRSTMMTFGDRQNAIENCTSSPVKLFISDQYNRVQLNIYYENKFNPRKVGGGVEFILIIIMYKAKSKVKKRPLTF